mmetsp:Transcript_5663/g.13340  ORF Transcript_5663/g.13340 Transcript_5663/m.13340 type:complete len:204 (-) Transcript_5663:958-1569(-)
MSCIANIVETGRWLQRGSLFWRFLLLKLQQKDPKVPKHNNNCGNGKVAKRDSNNIRQPESGLFVGALLVKFTNNERKSCCVFVLRMDIWNCFQYVITDGIVEQPRIYRGPHCLRNKRENPKVRRIESKQPQQISNKSAERSPEAKQLIQCDIYFHIHLIILQNFRIYLRKGILLRAFFLRPYSRFLLFLLDAWSVHSFIHFMY